MSVIDNCLKIQQLAEDLTAGWVMTRILSALPPKLHHFRSASATDKNISTLLERLRLEDDRLNQTTECQTRDGTTLEGVGVGDDLEAFNGNYWEKISLKDVLHVPDMPFNLFSVTQILDKGYVLSADANMSVFKSSDGKDTVWYLE
ncbi:hypothetical protein M8J77_016709 [Diaphorina citri]|nr:hypothetical protein M8J77_016709 [Diaphorina citri]